MSTYPATTEPMTLAELQRTMTAAVMMPLTPDEDMRAAAAQLATVPQRLIEMVTPYLPEVGEDSGDPPTTG